MKILMVSMPSLHFYRWTEQLKDAGHDIYWFNITDSGEYVNRMNWIQQKFGWKLKWNYPGRIFIKSKFPKLYSFIQKFNENKTDKAFENYLLEVQPDVVHSFALYVSCAPIVPVMEKYPNQKWIYSSWGSDLFYYQNKPAYLTDIKRVLPRVNYLFTDCNRDYEIAKKHGFRGQFLGVFPGGGGFDLEQIEKYKIPLEERRTILIKGFQGRSGRANVVLDAVQQLKEVLAGFEIVVFGADDEVFQKVKNSELILWNNFKVFGKCSHNEVLQLMGKALVYIGNSNSDGIPNTLLEAICAGAFPIQSNPGKVTSEIIVNGVNGYLIEDCESVEEIKSLIQLLSINSFNVIRKSSIKHFNTTLYEYKFIQNQILLIYSLLNDKK